MQPSDVLSEIRSLGDDIGPESLAAVLKLFDEEQLALARACPPRATNLRYGPDQHQELDIYVAADRATPLPVLVWVHGGGFQRGDKGGGDRWTDANVGRAMARAGYVGVVINYRLAPAHPWPAGAQDVGLVVDWLVGNIAHFGGDPGRIVLSGSSAGAAHVAGFIKLRPDSAGPVRGALLISGVYGITPATDERDASYYGTDISRHAHLIPIDAIAETPIPLMIACAQFDPPRFKKEFSGALRQRLENHNLPTMSHRISGHNHFSSVYHIGTNDTRFLRIFARFIDESCK